MLKSGVSNKMMLKLKYVLIISVITTMGRITLFAQHHISSYEYRWAVFHPFIAVKIKHRLPKAMKFYNEVRDAKTLDTLNSGGKLDAFRHVYTMAYLARNIKVKKLRKLGMAHEKGNKKQFKENGLEEGERPDSLACEMDLRNNELGFILGAGHKNSSDEELKAITVTAIKEGRAWYLKRNAGYFYVSCSNDVLDLKRYTGKWFIPKCLIPTNE